MWPDPGINDLTGQVFINVINISTVTPFETVMVIKGFTNTIELNRIEQVAS